MYKKILVPLDGAELAECVLDHVRAIVTGCQVPEVILLTVVEIHEGGPPSTTWGGVVSAEQEAVVVTKYKAEARDYIIGIANRLREEGMFVQPVVIQGNVAEGILEYVDKNQIDLIMMSTHGRSGLSRWVLGSVADRIIRHSQIPVFIISPKGDQIS